MTKRKLRKAKYYDQIKKFKTPDWWDEPEITEEDSYEMVPTRSD
jgi:hypothetical protein